MKIKFMLHIDNGIELIDFIIKKVLRDKTTDRYDYEVILEKKLLAPAFRRIIAGKVRKTEKTTTNMIQKINPIFTVNTLISKEI